MANSNDSKNTGGEPAAKTAKTVESIGTLTYPRAVEHFGKDRALEVMRKVAEIGGHGFFEDEHFKAPLFGGLQMPDPEKVAKPVEDDFKKLPEWQFHYQAALEVYEEQKKQTAANREKINEFYKSIK